MRLLVSLHWLVAISCSLLAATITSAAGASEPLSTSTIRPLADPPPDPVLSSSMPNRPAAISSLSDTAPQRTASPASFPRPGVPSPAFRQPLVEPQVTSQTRQALGFYGGYAARTTLSQMPRRAPIHTAGPQPMYRQLKPFNAVHHDPTVSPYLNLYRDEDDGEGAPNYHTFVRPQLEQIEANRMQHREIQNLRGQMQRMSKSVSAPQHPTTSGPGSRVPARYMDTAQFYGGWRR